MRSIWVLAAAVAFAATASASITATAQTAVNATGNWSVTPQGERLLDGTVRFEQTGSAFGGSYDSNGHIDGKFEPGTTQVDANWSDARGAGWMTIVFSADGRHFSGEWGRPGSRPSGSFVATRTSYPIVSGHYYVTVTGGAQLAARTLTLRQLGQDVVGNYGTDTEVDATMAADSNTLSGTWKSSAGHGWIKLQFADDSRSFQGTWGLAAGSEASGQIDGNVVDTSQVSVRGLWNIASSGVAFTSTVLNLQQRGQTVTGAYKDGHLQGTLPRGSQTLSGTWRDARRTGDFAFKFAADGKSFQGTWNVKGGSGGSIIGKRVIAASPALRQY